jgi:hypothetical protein
MDIQTAGTEYQNVILLDEIHPTSARGLLLICEGTIFRHAPEAMDT